MLTPLPCRADHSSLTQARSGRRPLSPAKRWKASGAACRSEAIPSTKSGTWIRPAATAATPPGIAAPLLRLGGCDEPPSALQCQRKGVRHGCLRDNSKLQPEMDYGLRDLRTDAADNAIGTHQPGSRYGLDQVLGYQAVNGRHPGDVDDGNLSAGLHDAIEQIFHHRLGALAIERADQRKENDPLPQLHYGRGKLQ